MVGSPDPSSLEVSRSFLGEVESDERDGAGLDGVAGLFEAVVHLDAAAGETAQTDMHVPHGSGGLLEWVWTEVPFDDDRAEKEFVRQQ